MVVFILVLALLILIAALAVEVGVASWNIRRAGRYRRQKDVAERQSEAMKNRLELTNERFRSLDKYATDISWLLKFLHTRYDKFSDIDAEIAKGVCKGEMTGASSEASKNYSDLVSAVRLLKITIRASEKMDGLMTSIATQIGSIIQDLEGEDEPKQETPSENTEGEPTEPPTEENAVQPEPPIENSSENAQDDNVQGNQDRQ